MPQISASVPDNTVKMIKEIADKEERTFSEMVKIILTSYAANHIKAMCAVKKKK